jgi:hypothetical protein
VIGDAENLCTGKIQLGITILTCLDLMLEESPKDLPLGDGNPGTLWQVLERAVEVREELVLVDVQGLSGATSYGGMRMGVCLDFVRRERSPSTSEQWSDDPDFLAASWKEYLFFFFDEDRLSFKIRGRFQMVDKSSKGVVLELTAG